MKLSVLVCTVVCFSGVALGQTLLAWTAEDYPNPVTEPDRCGRIRGQASYVCDPNDLISDKYEKILDHFLLSMPNDTQCPCATQSCETPGRNTGYIIKIALVKRLASYPDSELPDTEEEDGMTKAGIFAFSLLNRAWKAGNCEEMVLIVYSKDDHTLYTLTGSTARLMLTDQIIGEIQAALAYYFERGRDGIGYGLASLVLNYRRALDGEFSHPIMYLDGPIDGATSNHISAFATLMFTVVMKYLLS